MSFVIVIPFGSRTPTYLVTGGATGVKLAYDKEEALKFDSYEAAQAAVSFIRAEDVAIIKQYLNA